MPIQRGEPAAEPDRRGHEILARRFVFNVRDAMLYFSRADRQSDVWMAEVVRK